MDRSNLIRRPFDSIRLSFPFFTFRAVKQSAIITSIKKKYYIVVAAGLAFRIIRRGLFSVRLVNRNEISLIQLVQRDKK